MPQTNSPIKLSTTIDYTAASIVGLLVYVPRRGWAYQITVIDELEKTRSVSAQFGWTAQGGTGTTDAHQGLR